MITVTAVFDYRGRAGKSGDGAVDIRITVNRKVYYVGTGVRVRRDQFLAGQVINHEMSEELTERIRIVARKVMAYANECEKNSQPLVMKDLRNYVNNMTVSEVEKRTAFVDWFERQMGILSLHPDTVKHYRTTATRLREYGMTAWEDLTVENIYRFDHWLHSLEGRNGKRISDAGVFTYHKTLKAMLNRAEEMGKIKRNPYGKMKGKFSRGDRESIEYLTEPEMNALSSMELAPGSEMCNARDLFVFQMYTGMAYIDTQAFTIDDYHREGRRWVKNGERIKTGVSYVSELLPPVVEVLKRNGWQLPRMTNQAYNRTLKALGIAAKIKTPLHSHLARHTFATWMLRNGAKIENVSRMLGHTNITQTQRYAKVMAESVHEDFRMMGKKLKKKGK